MDTYLCSQILKSSKDELTKGLVAKSDEITKTKERAKNYRKRLKSITAEKDDLEIEYFELHKTNTVSRLS